MVSPKPFVVSHSNTLLIPAKKISMFVALSIFISTFAVFPAKSVTGSGYNTLQANSLVNKVSCSDISQAFTFLIFSFAFNLALIFPS